VGRNAVKRRLAHALPELVWLNDDVREAAERSQLVCRPLGALAKLQRRRLDDVLFVAVTGSTGKSTAKELIAAVLRSRLRGTSTPGNANADVGVAMTVLRTSPADDFSVLELGTAGPGMLRKLAEVARPRIAVITNVGLEHLHQFGDPAAIVAEKTTLVEALQPDGVAILNADDPKVLAMREICAGRVVTVGVGGDATYTAEDIRADWPSPLSFTLRHDGATVPVRTGLHGRHWVHAVLAAIAVGVEAGLPLTDTAAAVEAVTPARGRMQAVTGDDGVTFIRDDKKHELLTALRALDFLAEADAPRKVAVIGRIIGFEGDPYAAYTALAERALEVADEVIFTGPESRFVAATANGRLRVIPTVKETSAYLRTTTSAGDLVLLRASNRTHLGRVILARSGAVHCWLAACGRKRSCERCELLDFPSEPDAPLPSRLLPKRPQRLKPVQ
jgi:UDP-N-acetylmuramoyl-tripeptide--D-alanyl-D-alanine ligase